MSTTDDSPVLLLPRAQTAPELSDGERCVKEMRQHKWIGTLLAAIVGTVGAGFGAITAANLSQVNQVEVRNLKEATKLLEPRVKKNESGIASIETNVVIIKESQTSMATGIEELKQVNVKRLEKELDAKEKELAAKDRELQRLRNRNR